MVFGLFRIALRFGFASAVVLSLSVSSLAQEFEPENQLFGKMQSKEQKEKICSAVKRGAPMDFFIALDQGKYSTYYLESVIRPMLAKIIKDNCEHENAPEKLEAYSAAVQMEAYLIAYLGKGAPMKVDVELDPTKKEDQTEGSNTDMSAMERIRSSFEIESFSFSFGEIQSPGVDTLDIALTGGVRIDDRYLLRAEYMKKETEEGLAARRGLVEAQGTWRFDRNPNLDAAGLRLQVGLMGFHEEFDQNSPYRGAPYLQLSRLWGDPDANFFELHGGPAAVYSWGSDVDEEDGDIGAGVKYGAGFQLDLWKDITLSGTFDSISTHTGAIQEDTFFGRGAITIPAGPFGWGIEGFDSDQGVSRLGLFIRLK